MAKNGHNAKAIAHAKHAVWVKKLNSLKHAKNISTKTLKLFNEKNCSKKQLILEKWENFENGQKWSQCKGYSPYKMLSLGQKIKLLETCEKHFYKHIKVVLCKKTAPKNSSYSTNESILKMAKNGHKARAPAHEKYSVWVNK